MDDPNVEETTRVFVLIQFSSEYGKCTLGPGQPAQALCSDRRSMHGQRGACAQRVPLLPALVADKGAIELTYNPMGKGVICRVSPYQRFKPPLPAFANGHPLVGKSAKKEMWFLLGQFSSNNQTGSGGKEKQVFSAREALHPVANHRRLRHCPCWRIELARSG
jgi:hypothetical protein